MTPRVSAASGEFTVQRAIFCIRLLTPMLCSRLGASAGNDYFVVFVLMTGGV